MKKITLFLCLCFTMFAQAQVTKTVNTTKAGTLSAKLSATELNTVTNLTLTGLIDARDFKTMRDLMPKLEVLDMSDAQIVQYNGKLGPCIAIKGGGVIDGIAGGQDGVSENYKYLKNAIPDCAFFNTTSGVGKTTLKTITLPSSVTAIGSKSFGKCSGLKSFYAKNSNTKSNKLNTSNNSFEEMPVSACTLYVPAGTQSEYNTIAVWKSFAKIIETSVPAPLSVNPTAVTGISNLYVLSPFDNAGLPTELLTADLMTQAFKSKIVAALPEQTSVPATNPDYLKDASKANIKLVDSCELWVSFVTEGAAYKNTMGYFYYPTNTPPSKVADIAKRIVVFPNASLWGLGGSLIEGDKMKLKYFDESKNVWTNVFPAGLSIGWFLISDGFRSSKISNGYYSVFSIPELNEAPVCPQQNLILYDKEEEKMVIAFEDILRTPNYHSDQDFNDAIFYATANPITAVQTDDLIPIVEDPDSNDDGVPDSEDEYPTDDTKAFNNYFPGAGIWGTLAFEDLWPSKGDYDFNDLVADYNFQTITNGKNEAVEIVANFKIRAEGATMHNGFAFQMGIAPDKIASVTGSLNVSNLFTLSANGTEANQAKAVIPVVDDVLAMFESGMVNTILGGNSHEEVPVTVTIKLKTPVAVADLGTAPFNPFMIVDIVGGRGREVHLPYMVPTSLADDGYFKKGDDLTDRATGKYYVANLDFPWALNFPAKFDYPVETIRIDKAYLKFNEWVKSAGITFPDWYLNKTGYRDDAVIYKK